MPPARRIAVAIDLHHLEPRHRHALAGLRRYAEAAPAWQLHLDPDPVHHPAGPYHGVIAIARHPSQPLQPPVPLVSLIHTFEPVPGAHCVLPDLKRAGRLAARHLIACGFPRFAALGYYHDTVCTLLLDAYARGIRRSGLGRGTCLFARRDLEHRPAWHAFRRGLERLIDADLEPPIGIFVYGAPLARALASLCLRKGLHIPDDIAILVADDDPDLCPYPPPALSAVDLGYERAGHRAAALLDELIDTPTTATRTIEVPPGPLIVRRSTDLTTWRDRFAQQVVRYIADHCHEPLRAADVAAAFGLPLHQLQRRIRHQHPRGVADEILHARLDRARRLLLTTDLPVSDVALQSGFSSGRRLARLFRQHESLSPTEYRHKHGEERDRESRE